MSESWRVCVCVCVHVCMCAHMAQSLKLKAQLAFGSGVGGPWVSEECGHSQAPGPAWHLH